MRKAGGENLVKAIYENKVSDGSTFLTQNTTGRRRCASCRAAVRPVPYGIQRAYFHATMKTASDIHGDAAGFAKQLCDLYRGLDEKRAARASRDDFLRYLASAEGQAIYQRYGFLPLKAD